MKAVLALLVAAVVAELALAQDATANQFCRSCQNRRNSRDLYEHPTNCHQFYQCFFNAENDAVGLLRSCPPGTYFNIDFQACIYEGPYPCKTGDYCTYNATVNTFGCANMPGSCNLFIKCSTGTEILCCPPNTRYDASQCACVDDPTCNTPCTVPAPAVPTSVAPPTSNATHCTDSYGNVLTAIPNQPAQYGAVDADGNVSIRPCALGTQFSLELCRCDVSVPVSGAQPAPTQCSVFLPFDTNINDESNNHFATFAYNGADISTAYSAHGSGSFYTGTEGGRLEIPGTKNIDYRYQGSYCLFYRCPNSTCPTGGLLSNNDNADATVYSLILASLASNGLTADFKMQYPFNQNSVSVSNTNAVNGFNQVCVVYDGNSWPTVNLNLYINNQFAAQTTQNYSFIRVANCPYAVGSDQKYGNFAGYIDDVLLCPYAFGSAQVAAHYQGAAQLRELQMIP